MDKSPKYQKMCEEAGEIQKEWNPQEGDYVKTYWYDKGNPNGVLLAIEDFCRGLNVNKRDTFLPRQDQLQVMMETHITDLFISFFNGVGKWGWFRDAKSWEQLWLAFVMKEEYNKIWSDKELKWTHS